MMITETDGCHDSTPIYETVICTKISDADLRTWLGNWYIMTLLIWHSTRALSEGNFHRVHRDSIVLSMHVSWRSFAYFRGSTRDVTHVTDVTNIEVETAYKAGGRS